MKDHILYGIWLRDANSSPLPYVYIINTYISVHLYTLFFNIFFSFVRRAGLYSNGYMGFFFSYNFFQHLVFETTPLEMPLDLNKRVCRIRIIVVVVGAGAAVVCMFIVRSSTITFCAFSLTQSLFMRNEFIFNLPIYNYMVLSSLIILFSNLCSIFFLFIQRFSLLLLLKLVFFRHFQSLFCRYRNFRPCILLKFKLFFVRFVGCYCNFVSMFRCSTQISQKTVLLITYK